MGTTQDHHKIKKQQICYIIINITFRPTATSSDPKAIAFPYSGESGLRQVALWLYRASPAEHVRVSQEAGVTILNSCCTPDETNVDD